MSRSNFTLSKSGALCICTCIVYYFSIIPAVQGYTNTYIKLFFILLGIFLMFPMGRYDVNTIASKCIWLLPFLILEICILRESSYANGMYMFFKILSIIFEVSVPVYLLNRNKNDLMRKLFVAVIVGYTFTQITTIINIQSNAYAARQLVTGLLTREETYAIARLNIGGYSFAYLAPIVTLCLYILVNSKVINRLFLIVNIIISILFIIRVQFTLALIIYIVSVAVMLLSKGDMKRIIFTALAAFVAIYLLPELLVKLISFVTTWINSDAIVDRLNEVLLILNGRMASTVDASLRFEAYSKSFQAFLQNPILGNWNADIVGGHSSILDFIGCFGILGIVVLILGMSKLFYNGKYLFENKIHRALLVYAYVMFVIFALVNQAFLEMSFIVLGMLPLGASVMVRKDEYRL